MTEKRIEVSKNMVNVLPTLGTNSKKPNCVVMAIDADFLLDALALYKDKRKGIEREKGLIRIEAVAVYMVEDEEIPVDFASEIIAADKAMEAELSSRKDPEVMELADDALPPDGGDVEVIEEDLKDAEGE